MLRLVTKSGLPIGTTRIVQAIEHAEFTVYNVPLAQLLSMIHDKAGWLLNNEHIVVRGHITIEVIAEEKPNE